MITYLRVLSILLILTACSKPSEKGEEFVIQSMESYQRFTQKIWFAGEASNWELADFYAHEIGEVTEELVDNEIFHDGRNLSKLAVEMIVPQIEELDKAIDGKDEQLFVKNYMGLINSCNACHTTTDHDFIKIQLPTINPYNQEFSVTK